MRKVFKFNKCESIDDYSPKREGTYSGDSFSLELEDGKGLFFSPKTGVLFFDTYQEARQRLVEEAKEG